MTKLTDKLAASVRRARSGQGAAATPARTAPAAGRTAGALPPSLPATAPDGAPVLTAPQGTPAPTAPQGAGARGLFAFPERVWPD